MRVEISWYVPHRVIHCKYYGELTNNCVSRAYTYLGAMLTEHGHPPYVHALHDLTERGKLEHLNMLRWYEAVSPLITHPKFGWGIIITDNAFLRYLTVGVSQIAKSRVRVLPSVEEGVKFLQYIDQTLPPLPAAVQADQRVMTITD